MTDKIQLAILENQIILAESIWTLLQAHGTSSAVLANISARIAATRALVDETNEATQDRIDDLEEALQRIADWSDAYPIEVFPEPDWPKARALLEAGGVTLDSVSADCMRHCVEGVGKIAKGVLRK